MSDAYRNIADVIDVLNDMEGVYVTHVDNVGESKNYGPFELTIEVPVYERLNTGFEDNE